jgi:pimeloyl-ACP methyl ester carboxylesterase
MKILVLILFCLCTVLPAAGKEVRFAARDGQPLAALVDLPDTDRNIHVGVVLLPMYRSTKESWRPLVERLTRAGFTCLSLDLRGHGESRYGADGTDLQPRVIARDPQLFNTMYLDAGAAAKWLRDNVPGLRKMALVGASVGCSVAVQAVTRNAVRVDAVVLMTPGKKYLGVDTMADIRKWPGTPLLIISSEQEKDRGAAAIHAALEKQGARLQLYPQTNIHGTNMFGRVPGVENFIVDWLLGKTATE